MSATEEPTENEDFEIGSESEEKYDSKPRLLHALTLRNLLSFGPENERLELGSLNVLIGANGSGKSNLLAAIDLLRSSTTDMREAFRKSGDGLIDWIWKGSPGGLVTLEAELVLAVGNFTNAKYMEVQFGTHSLAFRAVIDFLLLMSERFDAGPTAGGTLYNYKFGDPPVFRTQGGDEESPSRFDTKLSVLAQKWDPNRYSFLEMLVRFYDRICIYREWTFGRSSVFRKPQRADLRNDRLEEDFSNLGMFLNRLRKYPKAKLAILEGLKNIYEGLTDYDVSVEGGTVQVFFTEGDYTIPATRLSDGSLRYLCLLAILCDPKPPPLICIDEPELGLHPDLLPKLADLLVEASERCQLIVTTHSDILVAALSDHPEAVIVCEKHEGQTTMKRLDPQELAPWLERYSLGQLWTKGQLGGNRW